MKARCLSVLTLTLLSAAALLAGTPEKMIFFIQADMRTVVDPLDLERGMQELPSYLPGVPVEMFAFSKNDYHAIYSGPMDKLKWPPDKFSFGLFNSATTPYKDLLKFLKDEKISNQTVYLITTGIDNEAYHFMEGTGLPNRYPVIEDLVAYLKANKVIVNIFYVKYARKGPLERAAYDALGYVADSSGGKFHFNFNTFPGIFKSVFGK